MNLMMPLSWKAIEGTQREVVMAGDTRLCALTNWNQEQPLSVTRQRGAFFMIRLKKDLQRELNLPGGGGGGANLTKA